MASINDVVIKIATVNGTGSASANGLLRKAIFRMGVPVVGKNYFPSNIQGLPTWYEIRVTGDGYQCRSDRVDIMVAMNAQTYAKDLAEVEPGGCLIYDSTWPRSSLLNREDITIIGIPLSRMCNEHFDGARARILMKNIAYVGAIAALLDMDLEIIKVRRPTAVDDNDARGSSIPNKAVQLKGPVLQPGERRTFEVLWVNGFGLVTVHHATALRPASP